MSEPMWGNRMAPRALCSASPFFWDGLPRTAADVTTLRLQMRAQFADEGRPGGPNDDDIEKLLLVFEELTSNGLRHGRAPVRVAVTTTDRHWLVDVSDAAPDRPPTPAVGRDAADGGLGLYLVARLSDAHGWAVQADRKHVWSLVLRTGTPAPAQASPRGGPPASR